MYNNAKLNNNDYRNILQNYTIFYEGYLVSGDKCHRPWEILKKKK